MPGILETYLGKPEIDHKFERAIRGYSLACLVLVGRGSLDHVLKTVTADIGAYSARDRHALRQGSIARGHRHRDRLGAGGAVSMLRTEGPGGTPSTRSLA